jgi:hypothetical protein
VPHLVWRLFFSVRLAPFHLHPFVPNAPMLGGMSDRFLRRYCLDECIWMAGMDLRIATRLSRICWWGASSTGRLEREAELLSIVKESERGLPAIRVWAHEELEGVARRLSLAAM